MSWLWEQYCDFALGIAVIYGAYVLFDLACRFWQDPRGVGARICGSIAWFFTLLAILWAAHLSDKYHWL